MAETPPSQDRVVPRYSDDEVDEIIAHRAIIEQAKGVLTYVYGVDADRAFKMLRSHACSNCIKLRLLAQRLLDDPSIAEHHWGRR